MPVLADRGPRLYLVLGLAFVTGVIAGSGAFGGDPGHIGEFVGFLEALTAAQLLMTREPIGVLSLGRMNLLIAAHALFSLKDPAYGSTASTWAVAILAFITFIACFAAAKHWADEAETVGAHQQAG